MKFIKCVFAGYEIYGVQLPMKGVERMVTIQEDNFGKMMKNPLKCP